MRKSLFPPIHLGISKTEWQASRSCSRVRDRRDPLDRPIIIIVEIDNLSAGRSVTNQAFLVIVRNYITFDLLW
jgi:hypothetical protein